MNKICVKSWILGLNLILLVNSIAGDYVPVYMWENQKTTSDSPAVGRINSETFKEVLKARLAKDPQIIVFAERNLSPEDFNGHDKSGGSTFKQLYQLQQNGVVEYLPYVEDPVSAIKQLVDTEILETSINNILTEPSIPKSRILIIDLNDAKDDEDRNDMLRRHDDMIFKIYNQLAKSNDNTLAVFTGRQSSWIIPEQIRGLRTVRHILADTTDTTNDSSVVYKTDHALIYANSAPFYFKSGSNINLTDMKVESTVEKEVLTVTLTGDRKPTVELTIQNSTSGYWVWDSLKVDSDEMKTGNISAPRGFSYHCTSQTFFANDSNINITFPGLQIQPFFDGQDNETASFGDAYDCVGFTTAPIWSGLFVTFILAFIMTMGLTMMMDIKTMDRFDDPKGKTIIINAAE